MSIASRSAAHSPYDDTGDAFPGASPHTAIAVAALTGAARDIMEGAFPPMWVRGEISDFKAHRNGHWYFGLRDRSAQVRAVIWSRDQRRIPAPPDDGMQVVAFGRLTVYAARGEMQFTVQKLEAEGDGLWRKALEATRKRLEADGLLAPERKRRLPAFPRTIAVVTSPDGAALRDILAVIRRRAMDVRVVVVPAAVQGDAAPVEIRSAIERITRWRGADLVIVGRGGGGREDLWAFNDERVARALADCPVPTISAVGHEIDITICDLVADVRAATPSAAAELATRSREDLLASMEQLGKRLRRNAHAVVDHADARFRSNARSFAITCSAAIERRESRLKALAGQIDALSPLSTLARGYAVPRSLDGRSLAGIADFEPGESYDLVVRDGVVRSTVTAATPNDSRE